MNVEHIMREIFKLMSVMVVIVVNHCFIDKHWMNFSFYAVVIFGVDIWILWMGVMAVIMLVMVFNVMYISMMIFMVMLSIVDFLEIFTCKFFMICSMMSSKNLFKVLMFYMMFLMMLLSVKKISLLSASTLPTVGTGQLPTHTQLQAHNLPRNLTQKRNLPFSKAFQ